MNNLKKERFLYLPHLSAFFHGIGLIYGLITRSPYARSPLFYGTIFFIIVSLFMMKKRKDRSGIHLFLTSAFIAVLNYQCMSISYPHHLVIDYGLYLLLASLTIFFLEIPQNILFVLLFSSMMLFKIKCYWGLTKEDEIILIILTFIIMFILFEAKRWLSRLYAFQLDSMKKLHSKTLQILGKVCEIKDHETNAHLKRVEIMVGLLVDSLMNERQYTDYLTEKYREDIQSAAYLHDIGKIGISDKILNKPGKLTREEFEVVKTHTVIGHNLLKEAQSDIADQSIFDLAIEITRHHHEKWDGSGYPDQLSNEGIPLSARIMAIVDVYDALISKRPYKEPYTHEDAIDVIRKGSGTHFDPVVARLFIDQSERIRMLIEKYVDA